MQPTFKGDVMKCVTPMFREYMEYSPEEKKWMKENDIKQPQRIIPRKQVYEQLLQDPNSIRTLDDYNHNHEISGNPWRWQTIPCRNCWACKLSYSAEWATRIMYECMLHPDLNWFITLTYDENWLPVAEKVKLPEKKWNKETRSYDIEWHYGENEGLPEQNEGTLWEPHVKKFIHGLRRHLKDTYNHDGLSYYYCGEYGTENHRPHYHLILMNCPLDPAQFYDHHLDDRKKFHFKSKEIEFYWAHHKNAKSEKYYPYGLVDIAEVEWSCAAYVARYCTKKLFDKEISQYAAECKIPEYLRMSRNIGREWYEEHKDEIYYTDSVVMKTVKGNSGAKKPPKAWDRLYEKDNPEVMEMIKESRKLAAERSAALERELSTYSDLQKLKMKAERLQIIGSQLPREL